MKSTLARMALSLALVVTTVGVSASHAKADGSAPAVVSTYAENFGLVIFKHQTDPVELQKQLDEWLKSRKGSNVIISTQLQYIGNYYVLSVGYRK